MHRTDRPPLSPDASPSALVRKHEPREDSMKRSSPSRSLSLSRFPFSFFFPATRSLFSLVCFLSNSRKVVLCHGHRRARESHLSRDGSHSKTLTAAPSLVETLLISITSCRRAIQKDQDATTPRTPARTTSATCATPTLSSGFLTPSSSCASTATSPATPRTPLTRHDALSTTRLDKTRIELVDDDDQDQRQSTNLEQFRSGRDSSKQTSRDNKESLIGELPPQTR